MQGKPVCFQCGEPVEGDPIYEALCGDDDCPSAVWHPVCLMKWREEQTQSNLVEVMATLANEFRQRIVDRMRNQ